MKKSTVLSLALCLLLTACGGEKAPASPSAAGGEEKLSVVATLFPQYDFARAIAGDRAEVRLLLPAGVESHSFEPAPADLVAVNECDVFLYTGPEMEPWAATLIDGGLSASVRVIDLSAHITMSATEEVALAEEDHEEEHGHVVDPHIWTSPANAMTMADDITEALCAADPDGEAAYRANAEAYQKELKALDDELAAIASGGKRKELIFGSRYAFHYFSERYGLVCYAAYDSCSEEGEPSAGTVAALIDEVRKNDIPVIYYEELTDPKIARAMAEETGAELLLLHSCHNLSKDEMAAGETYLSLMRQNAMNLQKGLN